MWLCLWCVWFQFAFSFSLNFLFPFLSRALRGVDRACRSIPLRRRGEALPGLGHRRGALLIFGADAPVDREERSVPVVHLLPSDGRQARRESITTGQLVRFILETGTPWAHKHQRDRAAQRAVVSSVVMVVVVVVVVVVRAAAVQSTYHGQVEVAGLRDELPGRDERGEARRGKDQVELRGAAGQEQLVDEGVDDVLREARVVHVNRRGPRQVRVEHAALAHAVLARAP